MQRMDDTPSTGAPAAADHSWARPGSEAAATPPPPSPARGRGNGALIVGFVVLLLALLGVAGGLGWFLLRADDDGSSYPVALEDDAYDLEAMILRNADMPAGIELVQRTEFDNESWASLLDRDDPEGRLAQLEAQERVRGFVAYYTWPGGPIRHLGRTLSITSQSTLYGSEEAAKDSIAGRALCGLFLNPNADARDFAVPDIADESVGFFVTEVDDDLGKSVETVICFRTGRIVHGVIQSGLDGTQDIGLVVRLAQRLLTRVENAYDGVDDPLDELDGEEG
jgi:hypothetical protein